MIITYNGDAITLAETISVTDFIIERKLASKGIAVAINNQIIPKSNWDETIIKENDQLLIITATQGG
jgi:sulfur carrier protein